MYVDYTTKIGFVVIVWQELVTQEFYSDCMITYSYSAQILLKQQLHAFYSDYSDYRVISYHIKPYKQMSWIV